MNKRAIISVVIGVLIALAVLGVFFDPTITVLGYLRGDKFYQGRSASYWRRVLRREDTSSLHGPEMIPFLIDALEDGNPITRGRSAVILGQIGPPAREAVPALLKACCGPDGKVDQTTLRYWVFIEEFKKEQAGQAEVKFETKDVEFKTEEHKAHFAAAEALMKIDPAAAKQAGLP
jgi:hypothetical protein